MEETLRSPREGNVNPLQCSCLENPRDRGAWWAAVYGVAQSRTRLRRFSSSSSSRDRNDGWWDLGSPLRGERQHLELFKCYLYDTVIVPVKLNIGYKGEDKMLNDWRIGFACWLLAPCLSFCAFHYSSDKVVHPRCPWQLTSHYGMWKKWRNFFFPCFLLGPWQWQ